jgi:DNA-binding MarR family transcriptional regulator
MATRLRDDELRAWRALLHAHLDVTRRLDGDLRREHGLSLTDYDILLRLANGPRTGLRMSDLAERVMSPPSTVTRRLDGLVASGLVARSGHGSDSRIVLATLTAAGRQRLRRAAVTHLRGVRERFTSKLTAAQLEAVAAALEEVAGPHRPH